MKKQILFVDDEPKILDGLRDLLRRRRNELGVSLAIGGEEAIEKLKESQYDIILTDLLMPKMDGAQLLAYVHENFPNVVRIMLSGYADVETGIRAMQVAHCILAKPCELETLENVIERSLKLKASLTSPALIKHVQRLQNMPSRPRMFDKLTQTLVDKAATQDDFIEVLEQDKIISGKVVNLVNYLFLTLTPGIAKIEQAVAYLGANIIKSLTLFVEVLDASGSELGFSKMNFMRHGFMTAKTAMRLSASKKDSENAFVAALFHDIGKLYAAREPSLFRERFQQKKIAKEENVNHSQIGAFFLDQWGFSYEIIEAVCNHHNPRNVKTVQIDTLAAVYVANLLVHEQLSDCDSECVGPDMDFLNALGAGGRLSEWRALASREVDYFRVHRSDRSSKNNPVCHCLGMAAS